MLGADDILLPHPPAVVESHQQKCMADFESCFPGVINKLTRWMKLSDDFKVMYENGTDNPRLPMYMIIKVGKSVGVTNWETISDELYNEVLGIARLLWSRRHRIMAEMELYDG